MRMGGVSRSTRRRVPPVTHTHALFAGQSHSIPDNLVALLGTSRAWNCSDSERVFGNTSGFVERENPLEQSAAFGCRASRPERNTSLGSSIPLAPRWEGVLSGGLVVTPTGFIADPRQVALLR